MRLQAVSFIERQRARKKKVWIERNQRATKNERHKRGVEPEVHLEIWLWITENAWWLCRFLVCLHALCCWYIHYSIGYCLDLARICFVLIMRAFLKRMERSDTCSMCDKEISVVGFDQDKRDKWSIFWEGNSKCCDSCAQYGDLLTLQKLLQGNSSLFKYRNPIMA